MAKASYSYLRLVSLCCRNWPSWLQARTSRLGSLSICIIRQMASNSTAFLALECCTFFDLGGSCKTAAPRGVEAWGQLANQDYFYCLLNCFGATLLSGSQQQLAVRQLVMKKYIFQMYYCSFHNFTAQFFKQQDLRFTRNLTINNSVVKSNQYKFQLKHL